MRKRNLNVSDEFDDEDFDDEGLSAGQVVDGEVTARRLLNPLFFIASLWDLTSAWMMSRPWSALVAGLPAILGASLALVVLAMTAEIEASRFTGRYQLAMQDARSNKDKTAESLWRRALMEMDPLNPQYRFEWALFCDEDGRADQARRVMDELAGGPSGGYVPAHLWIARQLVKQSKTTEPEQQEAIRHLESVIAIEPQSPEANAQLADLYLRRGQLDKAESCLTKAVQWFPHLRVPLAQVLARREEKGKAQWQLAQATDEIRTWLKRKPDDVESRLALADGLQLLGQSDAAEEVLVQASDGTDGRIRERLARTFVAKAARLRFAQTAADRESRRDFVLAGWRYAPNSPAVLDELAQLLNDGISLDQKVREQMAAEFDEQLGKDSKQPRLHLLLSLLLVQEGKTQPALEHLAIAANQDPQYGTQLGRTLRQLGQQKEAATAFEKAAARLSSEIASRPDDVALRIACADVQIELKRWQDARKVLQDGYELSHDSSYLHPLSQVIVSQFDACRAAGDPPQRQLDLLRDALTTWPESSYALTRLSELAFRSDSVGESARAELNKLRSSGARSQVLQLLGIAASKTGQSDLSLEYFTHAACLEVRDPFIQNNLAFALSEHNPPDLQRALELADSAVDKAPKQPEFRATRGEIYLKLKRWSDAEKDLNTALEAGLDRADVHASLATAYEQLKRPELAERHRKRRL